jgi:hypothetical protein
LNPLLVVEGLDCQPPKLGIRSKEHFPARGYELLLIERELRSVPAPEIAGLLAICLISGLSLGRLYYY